MSEISIINDFDVFREEINRLHEEILSAQNRRVIEYDAVGRTPPARIKFEELDLSRFKKEMLAVHKTLQWQWHNSRLALDAKKARFVAIAGICELIKDEYVGKFWDLYKKIIGRDKDNTVYEWIWNRGFREAGIEMLGDERREFVQTLVMESGVPKTRTSDIISFFVIYWRYLRGKDVFNIIRDLDSDIYFSHIPVKDRSRLRSLAATASEFTRAFALAISRLSTVFEYISVTDDIFCGNIDDWSGQIFKATGINPLTILRDGDQLRRLYNRILGFVSPEKLRRIMEAKPPGTEVTIPDGRRIRTDQYEKILLGQHKVDGALFTCLPALELELPFLESLPVSKVILDGDTVLLRSFSEIIPIIDGSVRSDMVRKLFVAGKNRGDLFYCMKKIAMEISLSTADGLVETMVSGKEGFVCYPYLLYKYTRGKESHSLSARVNSIKLVSADLRHREVHFFCNYDNEPLYKGASDHAGRAVCSERTVLLELPEPGYVDFVAVDGFTGQAFDLQGGEARVILHLTEVMLFSPYSHRQIKPRTSGASFLFGSRRFVLFAAADLTGDSLWFENCKVETTSRLGGYRVNSLVWENQSLPCSIQARMSGGQIITWAFEKCMNFNLYINPKDNSSPAHVVFAKNQRCHPSDFELVLNPFPDQEVGRQLFWNVIVNDSIPLKIPLDNHRTACNGDKSLCISGIDLEKMIQLLWDRESQVNALIEISLCTIDETLAHRRFFVFPNLSVVLPDGVQERDEFSVQVDLGGGNSCQKLLLKNPRGRSKVKIVFEYENGKWQLRPQKFEGRLVVEALETSLGIEAIPPCRAVKFGNREKGKVELPREILKRELESYDLLVVADNQFTPKVIINGKKQKINFSRISEGLWCLPLSSLTGIVQHENEVTILSLGLKESFIVKYRVALVKMTVQQKHLVDRAVTGICSFRGPVASLIKLILTPIFMDGKAGNPVDIVLKPDGNEVYERPFTIALPGSVDPAVEHYELSAVLTDNSANKQGGHEYGERWEILPESAVTQNDFGYLKDMISEFFESGKPFAAAKYLVVAGKIVPDSELDWFREMEKAVNNMLIRTSLNRVALQIVGVLDKEYLFKVKM